MIKGVLCRFGNGWAILESDKPKGGMSRTMFSLNLKNLPESEKQYLVQGNRVLFETVKSKKDGKTYAKIRRWIGNPAKVGAVISKIRISTTIPTGIGLGSTNPSTKLKIVDLDKKQESKSFNITAGY